jgi:DNA-binding beta-propeller fold protein YncE
MGSYYYRVVKYTPSNGLNGVIAFGTVTCGSSLNDVCTCGGIFVDQAGFIYYSDSTNHRVVKFQQFSTSLTLVAGISGSSGSTLNQLNNPAGIFVDSAGALYVSDLNN